MLLVWIALGGALGAISRYLAGSFISQQLGTGFPYGTLSVNILGSFLIGVLAVWLAQQQWGNPAYKQFLIVGFLGAFTTFSSFSLDSILLLQQERFFAFIGYIGLSVFSCLLATVAGIWVTKTWV